MRTLDQGELLQAWEAGVAAARKVGLDHDAAVDVGQDTAMECWQRLRVNGAGETVVLNKHCSMPLTRYAFGIGRNKAIDVLRKRRPMDAAPPELLPHPAIGIGAVDLDGWRGALTVAVAGLDQDLQEIYQLLYVRSLSFQQAAEHLGIQERQVAARAARLRRVVGRRISCRLQQPHGEVIDRVMLAWLNLGRTAAEIASALDKIGHEEVNQGADAKRYGAVLTNLSREDLGKLIDTVKEMQGGADWRTAIERKISRFMQGYSND
jgi:RNA polymerase sigma factor (sigma-70 family)